MKKMIILAIALMSLSGYAQEVVPEQIPWMVERCESTEWYNQQAEAWEKVTAREPTNENAWLNLSRAARYADWEGKDGGEKLREIIERMGKAIPGTYTYHFCARYNQDESLADEHIERAYQLMPNDRQLGEDYGFFIAYFWRKGKTKELEKVARRYYADSSVPSSLLRYNYNELQCLPEHAIYFGNGDPILLPKMAVQYGMKVHQDKLVVCASFLWIEEYYNNVCRQLGIEPENFDIEEYQTETTWKNFLPDRIRYIIKKSGRPSYFSPASLSDGSGLDVLKENLYNEGLVLKYSETPYDNYARVRENLEKNIRLDYLVEPDFVAEPQWQSAINLSYNYFILLSPLIQKYKEWGNQERSAWLQHLLTTALEQSKMKADWKENCRQYINQYIDK